MRKEFIKKLAYIQATLKAPKNQRNNFGNYNYRSAEDILEAVKPLLKDQGLSQTISDEVINIGKFNYIKSTVTVTDGEFSESASAWAREAEEQKGMNPSQISGSTSSYSRKYALNGMYNIDDTKDADATNTHGKENITVTAGQTSVNVQGTTSKVTINNDGATTVIPSFKKPAKPITKSDDL